MPSDDIAISARNLTKRYRLFGHPGDRVRQFFSLGVKQYHREFTALKDVSFDIRKGETVGIIGRNGSGKSTLLQIVCGILKPTAGTLHVRGRISALLELGAGFNPEFTGRENIFFLGAIMGFTQAQMNERLADIAAFADIGEYIEQPVRTYSSGMFVRLAFAVAIHLDPEILVIDEALGVGDAEFQERSISRMEAMQQNGATILFVSHSIPAIRNFCERVIWLDEGVARKTGNAGDVCLAYQDEIDERMDSTIRQLQADATTSSAQPPYRDKAISIHRATMNEARVGVGSSLTLSVELQFSSAFSSRSEFGLGVIIRNDAGRLVAVFNTIRDDIVLVGRIPKLSLHLPRSSFVPGRYWVSVNVCDRNVLFSFDELDGRLAFEVQSELNRLGIPRWEGEVACEHAWTW